MLGIYYTSTLVHLSGISAIWHVAASYDMTQCSGVNHLALAMPVQKSLLQGQAIFTVSLFSGHELTESLILCRQITLPVAATQSDWAATQQSDSRFRLHVCGLSILCWAVLVLPDSSHIVCYSCTMMLHYSVDC